jgi:hypothetical protein
MGTLRLRRLWTTEPSPRSEHVCTANCGETVKKGYGSVGEADANSAY